MADSNGGLTVRVKIDGVRETLAAFRFLPTEASTALRERTLALTETLAAQIRAAGAADSPQSALVAVTVRANRDRVPSVSAGGSRRVGRNRATASDILFGSEFGAHRRTGWYAATRYQSSVGRQFRPHVGQGSYWFFRTVEQNEAEIGKAWNDVADEIVREFGHGQ